MESKLDRRRGDRIPALELAIVAREPYETVRAGGGRYRSEAVELLLLSDEQVWAGCLRCAAVAPTVAAILAHQKGHPAPATTRRRQAKRVSERLERVTETVTEEEVAAVPGHVGTLPGYGTHAARRARLAEQAVPDAPPADEPAAAPRPISEVAADLERAEAWCRALRDELTAALATRTY